MKLATPSAYSLRNPAEGLRIEACPSRDGSVTWAIRQNGSCMACDGRWEFEPQPSSRTAEFFRDFRYPTAQAAYHVWMKFDGPAPDEAGISGEPEVAAEVENEDGERQDPAAEWRRLALQFDGHRMQALGHLRALLGNPEHATSVQDFLNGPPLSGEEVLAQRIASLAAKPQPMPAGEPLPFTPIFTVVAHRWGWLNAHHYLVGSTTDGDAADEMAESECDGRGGKYGLVVYEWTAPDEFRRVSYRPSAYGEEGPHTNHRIEMFQSIGQSAHEAATQGTVLLLNKDEAPAFPNTMKSYAATVPAWLEEVTLEKFRRSVFMSLMDEDLALCLKEGRPARTPEEQKVWFDGAQKTVEEKVQKLFERRRKLNALDEAADAKDSHPSP